MLPNITIPPLCSYVWLDLESGSEYFASWICSGTCPECRNLLFGFIAMVTMLSKMNGLIHKTHPRSLKKVNMFSLTYTNKEVISIDFTNLSLGQKGKLIMEIRPTFEDIFIITFFLPLFSILLGRFSLFSILLGHFLSLKNLEFEHCLWFLFCC